MTKLRIEPGLSESPQLRRAPEKVERSGWRAMSPIGIVVSIAFVFACMVFVVDRAWVHYQQYQAGKAAQNFIDQAQAELEAAGRANQASIERQRQARAQSSQGQWLAKNCQDWRRAAEDNRLPTAQEEMRRHCQAYQRYLDTGQVPTRHAR